MHNLGRNVNNKCTFIDSIFQKKYFLTADLKLRAYLYVLAENSKLVHRKIPRAFSHTDYDMEAD